MTRKEAKRRLAAALREQRAAQEEVRQLNARVVEETSDPPQRYYPSGHAMPSAKRQLTSADRERIGKLVDRAQKASDRLAAATADVVNLRRLVGEGDDQRPAGGASGARQHAAKKRKTPGQLDREIAQSLASSGQPKLADLFADPAATKTFVREMRHEIQKKQTSEKTAAALAARPYTVKRLDGERRELFGRYATEAEARATADRIGGWIEHGGKVVYGRAPGDHARRRSHASTSKPPSWKEIAEDYKRRAKAAREAGGKVKIYPDGSILVVPTEGSDEYFFQDWQADEFRERIERENGEVLDHVRFEDLVLAQSQNW